MEAATDLHRQPTLLQRHHHHHQPASSSSHRVHPEFLTGTGSRAVRERLSAAVTTRQLKRAAAANYTAGAAAASATAAADTKPLDFRYQSSSSSSSAAASDLRSTAAMVATSGSIFGLLSIKDEDGNSAMANTGSAIQDQPLDFSRKARPKDATADYVDQGQDHDMKPWKKSRGQRYFAEPQCRTSPPSVLMNGDLMMSATVLQQHAPHQKMAAVRPLQNHGHEPLLQQQQQQHEHQALDYYHGHLPPRLPVPYDMTTMTPSTDNAYSAKSYLEFRRQILSLHQSLGGNGNDDEGNFGAPVNGHIGSEYDATPPMMVMSSHHPSSRASSNSSCSSSVSPVVRRYRDHHLSDAATTSVGNVSANVDIGMVGMANVNRSASSTSSVEGIVGLTTTSTMPSTSPPSASSVRRRAGRSLPDEFKDDAYWERRRKNNEAAKRSRDARRAKEDEIAIRAAFLEQENLKLRVEVASLKSETAKLRCLLYNS